MRLTYDGIPDRFDAESILEYRSNLPQCRIVWHLRNLPEHGTNSSWFSWSCKRGNFYGSYSTGGRRIRDVDSP